MRTGRLGPNYCGCNARRPRQILLLVAVAVVEAATLQSLLRPQVLDRNGSRSLYVEKLHRNRTALALVILSSRPIRPPQSKSVI